MPVQAMIENIDKKKLCWNCEGSVLRSTANCPYCGVYLHPEEESSSKESSNFTPPYQVDEENLKENPIPQAPYTSQTEEPKQVSASTAKTKEDWKIVVFPLLLLMSGSMFLLFGVMMLLFSHHGYFTIRWDASYWFYYILVSIPLLYFGWKTVENDKL